MFMPQGILRVWTIETSVATWTCQNSGAITFFNVTVIAQCVFMYPILQNFCIFELGQHLIKYQVSVDPTAYEDICDVTIPVEVRCQESAYIKTLQV